MKLKIDDILHYTMTGYGEKGTYYKVKEIDPFRHKFVLFEIRNFDEYSQFIPWAILPFEELAIDKMNNRFVYVDKIPPQFDWEKGNIDMENSTGASDTDDGQ